MPSTVQYWQTPAQKMRFISPSAGTYVLSKSPVKYTMVSMTKAKADVPIAPAPNLLNGGSEFAAGAIPLEWTELDYQEYLNLQPYHLQPCTMIDMQDNGFFGWLNLGSFDWLPGVQAKTGVVKAAFIVSTPANGVVSVINTIASPLTGNLTASATTGGSLPASTTLYYVLTFFSNWGQTLMSPVVSVTTGASAGGAVNLSWTAPTTSSYRKARLWVSSSSSFVAGSTSLIKADVFSAWTQSWTDYCGTSGVTSQDVIPSINSAYIGKWSGGLWVNGT